MQATLVDSPDAEIANNALIVFDTIRQQIGTVISYDDAGTFSLAQNGSYWINWWVAADGTASSLGTNYSLNVTTAAGTSQYMGASPLVTGQVSGLALIILNNANPAPATVTLSNLTGDTITLEDTFEQASIVIQAVPVT